MIKTLFSLRQRADVRSIAFFNVWVLFEELYRRRERGLWWIFFNPWRKIAWKVWRSRFEQRCKDFKITREVFTRCTFDSGRIWRCDGNNNHFDEIFKNNVVLWWTIYQFTSNFQSKVKESIKLPNSYSLAWWVLKTRVVEYSMDLLLCKR